MCIVLQAESVTRSSSEAGAAAAREVSSLTAQVAQLQQELKECRGQLAAAQEEAAAAARRQVAALASQQEKGAALARELERTRCVFKTGWGGPSGSARSLVVLN
jgi:outer membrane murein-binding lipoprotein Lpp